ncbi:hypothetical protein BURK2_03244 [Burkholderiales bacterium]|nr:hypothetical protein BURK2_03244 [Burkholderiales bacterium]
MIDPSDGDLVLLSLAVDLAVAAVAFVFALRRHPPDGALFGLSCMLTAVLGPIAIDFTAFSVLGSIRGSHNTFGLLVMGWVLSFALGAALKKLGRQVLARRAASHPVLQAREQVRGLLACALNCPAEALWLGKIVSCRPAAGSSACAPVHATVRAGKCGPTLQVWKPWEAMNRAFGATHSYH